MQPRTTRRGLEIAPFRGLRYTLGPARTAESVTAPPYDVISPEEHRKLLEASPFNITRLTLGSQPGASSSYDERGHLLRQWVKEGVLQLEEEPAFYLNVIEYPAPGQPAKRVRFVGLIGLGRLHPFTDGIVLPHERTFPKVVDDRLSLLEATRTNLENIFLLYSDAEGAMDYLLESQTKRKPLLRVEAKPNEFHELHAITDVAVFIQLIELMGGQRPIIADGHHRYTTSLRFSTESKERGLNVPGADWQMMTFANLRGDGLSILATHRLVKLKAGVKSSEALDRLLKNLETTEGADYDLRLETRERKVGVRFPGHLKAARKGVARTPYALVHDLVLAEWLQDLVEEKDIRYFKEGTGEDEALQRGDGDLLLRMRPVQPAEFEQVVQGGQVFPHKTTYFYPKLWSGLVLWPLEEPERLQLK